jgi:hypothetical protein
MVRPWPLFLLKPLRESLACGVLESRCDRDLEGERGEGDLRGERERAGPGEGARLTDVGVCDRLRDRPREGDRDESMSMSH